MRPNALVFAAALACFAPVAGAQTPSTEAQDDPASAAQFDQFLTKFRDDNLIPSLSVMVLRNGEPVLAKAYGWSDDEGETPSTLDTTYSIASVTKPIAAAAIVSEAASGGLDLALPMQRDGDWQELCEWLSGSKIVFGSGGSEADGTPVAAMDCDRETTLAQMLNMRANGDGSTFVYNPIAFARIDRAIAGAGGRALRDIVRDNVMVKAGITDIALGWRDPKGGSALRLLALPFKVEDGRRIRTAYSDDDFRASAGIKASVRQLAQFDRALEEGAILPESWYERIFEEPVMRAAGDYRWGWFVQDWSGHRLAWHSGWDPEHYSAIYLKVPEQELTLIVLANTEAVWWSNSLVRAEIEKSPIALKFLELFVR